MPSAMDLYILLCIFSAVLCYASPQDKATSSPVGSTVSITTTCTCVQAPDASFDLAKDSHVASSSLLPSNTAPAYSLSTTKATNPTSAQAKPPPPTVELASTLYTTMAISTIPSAQTSPPPTNLSVTATTIPGFQTPLTLAAGASSALGSSIVSPATSASSTGYAAMTNLTSKFTSYPATAYSSNGRSSAANISTTMATGSIQNVASTVTAQTPSNTPPSEIRTLIEKGLKNSDQYIDADIEIRAGSGEPCSLYCGIQVRAGNTSDVSTSIPRCFAEDVIKNSATLQKKLWSIGLDLTTPLTKVASGQQVFLGASTQAASTSGSKSVRLERSAPTIHTSFAKVSIRSARLF